jgi:hypothetical protein
MATSFVKHACEEALQHLSEVLNEGLPQVGGYAQWKRLAGYTAQYLRDIDNGGITDEQEMMLLTRASFRGCADFLARLIYDTVSAALQPIAAFNKQFAHQLEVRLHAPVSRRFDLQEVVRKNRDGLESLLRAIEHPVGPIGDANTCPTVAAVQANLQSIYARIRQDRDTVGEDYYDAIGFDFEAIDEPYWLCSIYLDLCRYWQAHERSVTAPAKISLVEELQKLP